MNTDVGLSHNSVGTVVDIIQHDKTNDLEIQDIILVEFKSYTGKHGLGINKNIIPIIQYNEKKYIYKLYRKNYPLQLAYARTVHSCQGITCNKLIYLIGNKIFNKDLL